MELYMIKQAHKNTNKAQIKDLNELSSGLALNLEELILTTLYNDILKYSD